MSSARLRTLVLIALVALHARTAQAMDAAPLERHLRTLRAQIRRLSSRSFVTRYRNGQTREKFTTDAAGYMYELFDEKGAKMLQWSHKNNGQLSCEVWYAPRSTKERMLEDDRTVSYTSFYKTGQKWEQYLYNKAKMVKMYDVYNKDGKLVR